MIIKVIRIQGKAFKVDFDAYPKGYTKDQILKEEKTNAEEDPDTYFDGYASFVDAVELHDVCKKGQGDTITFNVKV